MRGRELPWTRLRGFLFALAIGAAGGAIFNYFHLPLAWMLGAVTACTIASCAGLPLRALDEIRPLMMAVIGVLLGAGFSPGVLGGLLTWLPTLAGLLGFVLAGALLGTLYFRLVARFDLPTAFFAAMPGGFIEMITLGKENGGNPQLIALVHSARVLLVVLSLPYVMIVLFGVDIQTMRAAGGTSIVATPWTAHVWLVSCAVLGMVVGKLLKLPAKDLLGPMLLSGAVHVGGISDFRPAAELVLAAQLFLGTSIGCRFAGVPATIVLKVIALSGGSVAILVAVAVGCSQLMSRITAVDPATLFLAYSPGGLTETSLVALSIGLDVTLVASHHVARVLIVLLLAIPAFSFLSKRFKGAK